MAGDRWTEKFVFAMGFECFFLEGAVTGGRHSNEGVSGEGEIEKGEKGDGKMGE